LHQAALAGSAQVKAAYRREAGLPPGFFNTHRSSPPNRFADSLAGLRFFEDGDYVFEVNYKEVSALEVDRDGAFGIEKYLVILP